MKLPIRVQLSLMMFLQFFVWGAWYGQMGKYLTNQLAASGDQVGFAYAAFSVAMIAAPFFVGMLADRYFAAQKVLGILNLSGAALLFFLTQIQDPDVFIVVMLLYCLTFAPTIALTSSISMRQMTNPEKEFPAIRVFGTISWIVVVNIVGFMGVGDQVTIFQISMIAAALLGILAFSLPNTPPLSTGPVTFGQIVGKDAFVLFKDRSFTVFFFSSILICIPLSFYYAWANSSLTDGYIRAFPAADPNSFNIENKMSLGQASEVIFMLLLPLAFRKLGVKKILIIGLIAWIIRFLFFGYGTADTSAWMLYAAILLHGVCYDFFFVTGMIYTDLKAGDKIKSQAQGLISIATYGIGMFIGSVIAGKVKDLYSVGKPVVTNWTNVWLVPAGIAAVVLILFFLFFRENGKTSTSKT
ncbi:MFS transporter [Fulvivirgaceae bacterium PWU4]|uniref:MFS transporter n=1 Tax=Chryseosolibacter histidini TaxID=2782349 RepID=A0AAP2DNE3_9BACT|nr:MFS transporter [Chryseosolibacter histidini]MBT1697259.1 MFS transporter [Chryseosolibacter histidini]